MMRPSGVLTRFMAYTDYQVPRRHTKKKEFLTLFDESVSLRLERFERNCSGIKRHSHEAKRTMARRLNLGSQYFPSVSDPGSLHAD